MVSTTFASQLHLHPRHTIQLLKRKKESNSLHLTLIDRKLAQPKDWRKMLLQFRVLSMLLLILCFQILVSMIAHSHVLRIEQMHIYGLSSDTILKVCNYVAVACEECVKCNGGNEKSEYMRTSKAGKSYSSATYADLPGSDSIDEDSVTDGENVADQAVRISWNKDSEEEEDQSDIDEGA